jgi:hypothetical protein
MTAIDEFASTLLEEAKQFLEKSAGGTGAGVHAYLHAALMLGFSALEAHLNAIAEDFETRKELTPHETAVLLEKTVRLEDGEFKVTPKLQMSRIEDRIQLLHRKFAGVPADKSSLWWMHLMTALNLRNELTHPKGVPTITRDAVSRALQAIVDALDAIYKAVYKRRFPAASRGLQSRVDF